MIRVECTSFFIHLYPYTLLKTKMAMKSSSHKQASEPPMHLFKSFSLFLIALFLLITTAPFGLLFALGRQLLFRKLRLLSVYLLEVALVIDQAGNVIMQHLLNFALLKQSKKAYLFGNKNETISSVIGKNHVLGTLSFLGASLDKMLNFIDKNHSLDSIIYDIKSWAASGKVE
jgi:hypothetical protein